MLTVKSILFWCGDLSSFLHIVIISCTIFVLYKCNYKSLIQVIRKRFFLTNDVNGIFPYPSPLPTSSNNIFKVKKHWETLILINLKRSTKSSTKHCNSKKILCTLKCFAKCSFFFTNLFQGNSLYHRSFFILTNFLILPVLLLKWNKTCCIEFFLVRILLVF